MSRRRGSPRIRLLRHVDGLRVYIVNGTKIRDTIDQDFTQGGNEGRYRYVPKGEIWIDVNLNARDREATIIHELVERRRMLGGESYSKAHDAANRVERRWRRGQR